MIPYLCGMNYRLERRKAKLDDVCSKYVYPWLRDVSTKAKAYGAYPLCLCDYYKDPLDKQAAELVCLPLPIKGREKYIIELHNRFGTSLWDKITKRDFMELTKPGIMMQNPHLNNAVFFNLFDWIWEVCYEERVPFEYVVLGELDIIKPQHSRPLSTVCEIADLRLKLQMILVKMTLKDGYGTGLWEFFQEENLPCPLIESVREALSIFYPICNVKEELMPEITSFIGFEKQIDFLYAAWGYQRLREAEPEITAAFERRLLGWSKSLMVRYNLKVPIPTDSIKKT